MYTTCKVGKINPISTKKLELWFTDTIHERMKYDSLIFLREITFDNAEELTEEGLPLMVLFYHPNNTLPIKQYKEKVETELISEKRKIFNSCKLHNCVIIAIVIHYTSLFE